LCNFFHGNCNLKLIAVFFLFDSEVTLFLAENKFFEEALGVNGVRVVKKAKTHKETGR
jgi:hypothetical protein